MPERRAPAVVAHRNDEVGEGDLAVPLEVDPERPRRDADARAGPRPAARGRPRVRLMPTITSPSLQARSAPLTCVARCGRSARPASLRMPPLGLDRGRHRHQLAGPASTVTFSAVTVGRSPVSDARGVARAAARSTLRPPVAHVQVELHRLPVEIVAEPAAVGLRPGRRPPRRRRAPRALRRDAR